MSHSRLDSYTDRKKSAKIEIATNIYSWVGVKLIYHLGSTSGCGRSISGSNSDILPMWYTHYTVYKDLGLRFFLSSLLSNMFVFMYIKRMVVDLF